MVWTRRGLELLEGLGSEAITQAGRGGAGAPSHRAGAPRPGDPLPLTSSGWGAGVVGCQVPGARVEGLMPGAPWARPGHGGDSTSQRLLSLHETRRLHMPSSVRWGKQRARQAGCLFYFTCFTASAEAAPRRPATHNLASEFALTHSLAHSVEILLVPAACRGTLSQAAGTQELPSPGGWKFLGFKFQFHAFFLKHWHLRRGAVGGSLQDRVWLGPKRGH